MSVSLHNFYSVEMNPWSICQVANLRGMLIKLLERHDRSLERSLLTLYIGWVSRFEMANISLTSSVCFLGMHKEYKFFKRNGLERDFSFPTVPDLRIY